MTTRLLVPLDGSPLSEQVLPAVRTFTIGLAPCVIELLYVLDPAATPEGTGDLLTSKGIARAEHLAQAYLETQAKSLTGVGVEVHQVVTAGPPARQILEHARRGQFDYIFMATHGRSGLARAMVGSVTDRVIREAAIPVVAIHPLPVTDASHPWPGDDAPSGDLIPLLGRGDVLSTKAMEVLVRRGGQVVPQLITSLSSPIAELRQHAARTLGAVADPMAVPALVERLSDNVWEVRWEAEEALVQFRDEGVRAVLESVVHAVPDRRRNLSVLHVLERAPMHLWETLKPVIHALQSHESDMAAPLAAAKAVRNMAHRTESHVHA